LHSVVPDPKKCSELTADQGLIEKYVGVALQLGNNNSGFALDYVMLMHNRVNELITAVPVLSDSSLVDSNLEIGCSVCKEDNPLKTDQIISCSHCLRVFHTFCVGLRKIPPFGTKTTQDIIIREKYLKTHFGEWKCQRCEAELNDNGIK
jgi:hypothetical protein